MKNEAIKVLQKKKQNILEGWLKFQLSDDSLREDLMSNEELRSQSADLLDALLDNLNDSSIENPSSPDFEGVNDILEAISIARAKQGFSPRETGNFVFSLKDALLETLQQEIKDPLELYLQSIKVSKLIENFGLNTFETFISSREEVILRQTDEITEISTPVIQVWDGILALPIIGTLDSARTQVVMENLLQKIVETGSSIAILDISGVPAVDSLVAPTPHQDCKRHPADGRRMYNQRYPAAPPQRSGTGVFHTGLGHHPLCSGKNKVKEKGSSLLFQPGCPGALRQ